MISKKPLDVKIILNESYIKTIKNSVGSNLFRNLYAYVNGKKKDILESGVLSCALYVSSILYLFKLISDIHATVQGTVANLKKSGWTKTKKPREGAILVWEASRLPTKVGVEDPRFRRAKSGQEFGSGEAHKHIGFYIDKNKAISNSYKKRWPTLHHWTFGTENGLPAGKAGRPVRKVEQILWNKKLDKYK